MKKNLNAERKEIIERQSSLKSMAKVLFALILSLILLFGALYLALKKDMTLPYLATLLLAAVGPLHGRPRTRGARPLFRVCHRHVHPLRHTQSCTPRSAKNHPRKDKK